MIYSFNFTAEFSALVLICADTDPLAETHVNINFIKCKKEWSKNT